MDIISTNPSLTFVIPTYNRKDVIKRSIDSVLNNYPGSKIIILDVNTTDDTLIYLQDIFKIEIIDKIILIISLDYNYCLNYARNIGYMNATTDWVAFLDSGDEVIFDEKFHYELNLYDQMPALFFRCVEKELNLIGKFLVKSVIVDTDFYLNSRIGEVFAVLNKKLLLDDKIIFDSTYKGNNLKFYQNLIKDIKFLLISNVNVRLLNFD